MSCATNAAEAPVPVAGLPRVTQFRFHDLVIDLAARTLSRQGTPLAVQPRAFDVIAYLLVHRGRAVGRDELISGVWGRVDISDSALAQAIRVARRTLGDSGERQQTIRTVFGFGYQWVADPGEAGDEAIGVLREVAVPTVLPFAPVGGAATGTGRPNRDRLHKVMLVVLLALATCGAIAVGSAVATLIEHMQAP